MAEIRLNTALLQDIKAELIHVQASIVDAGGTLVGAVPVTAMGPIGLPWAPMAFNMVGVVMESAAEAVGGDAQRAGEVLSTFSQRMETLTEEAATRFGELESEIR